MTRCSTPPPPRRGTTRCGRASPRIAPNARRLAHGRGATAIGAAIAATLTPATTCVLVDCITLLASNAILALPEGSDDVVASAALNAEIDRLLEVYARSKYRASLCLQRGGVG